MAALGIVLRLHIVSVTAVQMQMSVHRWLKLPYLQVAEICLANCLYPNNTTLMS